MPESRRLIAELPDDAMVKLVDGSYVPNRQPFAEDGGSLPDVAQPVDVRLVPNPDAGHGAGDGQGGEDFPSPTWVGEDGVPPEDAAPIPQRKVMGEVLATSDVVADELLPVPDTFWVAVDKTGEMHEPQPDERQRVPDFAWLEDARVLGEVPGGRRLTRAEAEKTWPNVLCDQCGHSAALHRAANEHPPGCAQPGCGCRGFVMAAPAASLELTIALKAPRAKAEALAAKLREELGTLGATVTVETYMNDREPEPVAWQRHVCAAWARALGQRDVTAANAPTVLDLQDATAAALNDARARAVETVTRMWSASLGVRRRTEPLQTPETLIDYTVALVAREEEQQHAITNLQQQVAEHRATIARLTSGGQTPDSGSVNENAELTALRALETLVLEWREQKTLWRNTPSPGDQPFYERADELEDAMEAWAVSRVAAKQEPAPAPAPEEPSDDDLPF